ncbi:hypothetical protein [Lysinibacillus sp. UBA5990]
MARILGVSEATIRRWLKELKCGYSM